MAAGGSMVNGQWHADMCAVWLLDRNHSCSSTEATNSARDMQLDALLIARIDMNLIYFHASKFYCSH